MNSRPVAPNLTCPVPTTVPDGYYTDQQSHLNVARKDKFMLIIDVPNILRPLLQKEDRYCRGGSIERLEFSIWGYVVPQISINKLEVPYGGQTAKFSGLSRPSYDPLTVNFTVDNRFDNYYILYQWLNIQNNESTSFFDGQRLDPASTGKGPDYKTIFTVLALDEYDKPTARWDYYGAFPTNLGAINVSDRETDELETTVTFEFTQIKMSLI